MIYKISGNQRLIWKFYKTDDNKWRWYCHEKNGYLLSQSDNAYNSQLLCIENAKNRDTQTNRSCHFFYIFPIFRKKAGNGINVMIVDIL